MIETKEQMWAHVLNKNPALDSGSVRMDTKHVERLVYVVWQQCELSMNRKHRPLGCDLPPVFDFLRGMR
jgi:hypothetical protein